MPFTARIMAVNETGYAEDILLLNKDPYGAGWLVKVDPTDLEAERDHLLKGEDAVLAYQKRIEELETLIHNLEARMAAISEELSTATTANALDKVAKLGEEYDHSDAQLTMMLEEWDALSD